MWFDTHAHVDHAQFAQDREAAIERAREAGVTRFVNIGHNRQSARDTLELIDRYDWIYGTLGLHPHDAKDMSDALIDEYRAQAAHPKILAIGEIGLDFHYEHAPRDVQRQAFRRQIRLAGELALPVAIHDREAHRECLDILTEEGGWANGGIFHCYSGSAELAREIVEKGFYISFSGVLTFPNTQKLRKAAAWYLLQTGKSDQPCRFDVLSLLLRENEEPQEDWIQNAF